MGDIPEAAVEAAAKAAHDAYEANAAGVGYRTRPESRVQWDQLDSNHRELMVRANRAALTAAAPLMHAELRQALDLMTCGREAADSQADYLRAENERLREALLEVQRWADSHPRHAYVIHIGDLARRGLADYSGSAALDTGRGDGERRVDKLLAGNWFLWCDRPVRFIRATDHKKYRRHSSRRLVVTCEGTERRLAYTDNEIVQLCAAPSTPGGKDG